MLLEPTILGTQNILELLLEDVGIVKRESIVFHVTILLYVLSVGMKL